MDLILIVTIIFGGIEGRRKREWVESLEQKGGGGDSLEERERDLEPLVAASSTSVHR